jgi:hypothetical protein
MNEEVKTKSKRQFLQKLAALQEEYNVAICSRNVGEYSEVIFQMHDKRKGKYHQRVEINTHRTHSTAYEIRCIARQY